MTLTRRTLSLLTLFALLSSCRGPAESARRKLEELGLELDTPTFLDVIAGNDLAAAELFLTAGIDPNAWEGERRELPLMVAVRDAEPAMVELLLKGGSDPDVDSRILAVPAALGRTPIVGLLLDAGADPETKDRLGRTALIHAVEAGETEVARRLLGAGAQVDVEGGKYPGMTPLFYATQAGDLELLPVLLEAGADPDVPGGRYQLTPLMFAAWTGNVAIVRLLLEAGADPGIRNFRGETATSLASRGDHSEIVRLLSEAAAKAG